MLPEVLAQQLGAQILATDPKCRSTARWADWYAQSAVTRARTDTQQVRLASLIAGICHRESGGGDELDPRGPAGKGDNGHAFGVMQIDERYHGAFLRKVDTDGVPLWQKPQFNIDYGAGILWDNLNRMMLACPNAPALAAEMAAVCAYNAAFEKCIHALAAGRDPNPLTTGGNYGNDVVAHASRWMPRLA